MAEVSKLLNLEKSLYLQDIEIYVHPYFITYHTYI